MTLGVPPNPYEQSHFPRRCLRPHQIEAEGQNTALFIYGLTSGRGRQKTRCDGADEPGSALAEEKKKTAFGSCEQGCGGGVCFLRKDAVGRTNQVFRRSSGFVTGVSQHQDQQEQLETV